MDLERGRQLEVKFIQLGHKSLAFCFMTTFISSSRQCINPDSFSSFFCVVASFIAFTLLSILVKSVFNLELAFQVSFFVK